MRRAIAICLLLACAVRADDAGLRRAPEAFRAALARARPSIVTIETHGGSTSARTRGRGMVGGVSKPGEGASTGVIVDPKGIILTSTFHFLTRPGVVTVTLADGSRHVAEVLGRDDTRRLCALKIKAGRPLPVPDVAPRDGLRVGQWAVSVGVGYGGAPAMSVGIISATSRVYGRAVQTDANISPANYGGPLLDIRGRVIGLCAPLSPELGNPLAGTEWYDSGIGFAVPLDGLGETIAALARGETIRPGRLGVLVNGAAAFHQGVPIMRVAGGSPAAKAGLKPKDVILAVGEQRLIDGADLTYQLGCRAAGDTVVLTVRRGGEEVEIKATLGSGAAFEQAAETPKPEG